MTLGILTVVIALTDCTLPFDQRSPRATVVANNITARGPYLADFLRAGPRFATTTLSRFTPST